MPLVFKNTRADVTLERFDVTIDMNSGQVSLQVVFTHKLPAADLTLVLGVRVLWSFRGLSVHHVVVSGDG